MIYTYGCFSFFQYFCNLLLSDKTKIKRIFVIMKKIFLPIFMMATVLAVHAQSGTNSPYSQYDLGVLSILGKRF